MSSPMLRTTSSISPRVFINTPNAARIELDAALMRVINPLLRDDTEFYKQFVQNESFKRFVTETVLSITRTYPQAAATPAVARDYGNA